MVSVGVVVIALCCDPELRYVPHAVLAAIVLVAVVGLLKPMAGGSDVSRWPGGHRRVTVSRCNIPALRGREPAADALSHFMDTAASARNRVAAPNGCQEQHRTSPGAP